MCLHHRSLLVILVNIVVCIYVHPQTLHSLFSRFSPRATMSSEPAFQPGCELFTVGWLPADGLLVTGTLISVQLVQLWVDLQCLLLTSSGQTPLFYSRCFTGGCFDHHSLSPVLFSGWPLPREWEDKQRAPELCSWRLPDMLAVSAAQLGILPLAHRVSGPHCGGEERRLWDC